MAKTGKMWHPTCVNKWRQKCHNKMNHSDNKINSYDALDFRRERTLDQIAAE